MKHDKIVKEYNKAQDAEEDIREYARECVQFVDKRDGQWEPDVVQKFKGKPRYTDDRTTPILNQVAGEMSNAEFTIRVRPSGGTASKEVARIYDGIVRSIRNQSGADQIFKMAARNMLKSGINGWEISQKYADDDSFDQELVIDPIFNYENRVWIDPYSLKQDNSDAKWGVVLDYISKEDYQDRFPEGRMLSIGHDYDHDDYAYKPEYITIGRAYYVKSIDRDIVLMSDGRVFEDDDDFKQVSDELALAGITEVDRRSRPTNKVFMRHFDNGDWLDDEVETVFSYIPIVTCYANYSVSEGKRLYYGLVEKLLDPQRVHNYAFSREIEEVALSPRAKYWMTPKQAKGFESKLSTLNTNMEPIQLFNPDPELPGAPQQNGGGQINPALRTIVQSTADSLNYNAGLFSSNMGDNPGLQSGVAIDRQIDRGNNGTAIYFDAMEVAIGHTGKILVDAIPKVYDSTRVVRVLQEDGGQELIQINQPVVDQQTGETIYLNDLGQGSYDVVCDMGAAYKNRQKETADLFAQVIQYDPAIMEMGRDIWLNSLEGVGFDDLAERARGMMIQQGLIPLEQMTQEERQMVEQAQAANQEPQEDPNMLIAQAEMLKGQADMMAQENKRMELEIRAQDSQIKGADVQLRAQGQSDKLQSETALNMAKIQQGSQKLDIDSQKVINDLALKLTELEQKYQTQLNGEMAQNIRMFNPQTGEFE